MQRIPVEQREPRKSLNGMVIASNNRVAYHAGFAVALLQKRSAHMVECASWTDTERLLSLTGSLRGNARRARRVSESDRYTACKLGEKATSSACWYHRR